MTASEMIPEHQGTGKRQFRLPLIPRGAVSPEVQEAKARRTWPKLLRIAGCVAFLIAALLLVDLSQIKSHLARLSWQTLVIMTGLHIVIVLLAAWRFALIARAAGARLPALAATRLTFATMLANMLLPTSLAGDAGRIFLVRRYGLSLKAAVAAGMFDRIIGLASLGAIVLLGSLLTPALVPVWGVLVLLAACAALAGTFLMAARPPGGASRNARLVLGTTLLSLAGHAVSVAIVHAFLQTQAPEVGIGALAVLFPAVILAASVPVSVGGWGTRELAAAAAFGAIGLDPSIAVAMAFMYGVTQTASAAVGTAVLAAFHAPEVPADD